MTTTTINGSTNANAINSNNATYSTARTGGGSKSLLGVGDARVGQRWTGSVYQCYETFIEFDTTGIVGASDTITSATLRLYLRFDDSTTDFTAEAYISDYGTSVTTADYVSGASLSGLTKVATLNSSGIGSTGAYKSFADVALPANVVKNGVTRLVIASNRLASATAPTGSEYLTFYASDATNPPKLDLTYSSDTSATAGTASSTGQARQPSASVKATAGVATATGTANRPSASVKAQAGIATATAAALDATATTGAEASAQGGVATATGTAHGTDAAIAPRAGTATATGTANTPVASVKASAGTASATGQARQPSASVKAPTATATATGAAHGPAASIRVTVGTVTATGEAHTPAASVKATAGVATATGAANGASISTSSSTSAAAGAAAAIGAATQPSVSVRANAGVAEAIANAWGATITASDQLAETPRYGSMRRRPVRPPDESDDEAALVVAIFRHRFRI